MSETENKRTKLFIVVLLAIILGGIVVVQIKPKFSKAIPIIKKVDSNQAEESSQEETSFTERIPQIAKSYIMGRQADEQNTSKGIPQIEASYIYDGKSFISVGGKLIREGENINGFKFLKTYRDRVEFEKNGQIITGTVHNYPKYKSSASDN